MEAISIYDHKALSKLDRYILRKLLPDNKLSFDSIMNVPMDGWCMLYAFQMAMLIDNGIKLDLLEIRLGLLNEYENLLKTEEFKVHYYKNII